MKLILQKLKKYKLLIALAIVVTVIQCLIELRLPAMMAEVVNSGVLMGNMDTVKATGIRMLVASVTLCITGYMTSIACAAFSQRFALDLRKELYSHIQKLSYAQVHRLGEASLINRLTVDVECCASFANVAIMLFVEPLILMVGGIVMMWNISSTFGLVFVVFVVLQFVIMMLFMRRTAKGFRLVQESADKLNRNLQTSVAGVRMIKSFTMEDKEETQFVENNQSFCTNAYAIQKVVTIFNPLIMLLMNLAVAVILYIAGYSVNEGAVLPGNILAAITYSEQVLLSIMIGGKLFQAVAQSIPSSGRIKEILDEPELLTGEGIKADRVVKLSCEKVGFAYPESGEILSDVDLEISAGEFVAVTGRTGSGKSTLADVVSGFIDPTSGTVKMNDIELHRYDRSEVRRHIALTDKSTTVFAGTLYDNITFGRDDITADDVTMAMETACIADMQVDRQLASSGISVSGGEKQRIVIARALAGKPDVLVLDDSTSALDYSTETRLIENIRKSYPDIAIIMMTQRKPSASRADREVCL